MLSHSPGDAANSPCFWRLLTSQARAELRQMARAEEYQRGDVLIMEGDTGKDVAVILHGWVKVVAHGVDGYESLLAARGPGDIVGEMAILGLTTRTAEVRAISETHVLWVSSDDFAHALQHDAELGRVLLTVVTGRLRHADQWRARCGSLEVPQRLAILLLELMGRETLGVPSGSGWVIPFGQDELAGFIGTSRRSVGRALQAFRRAGWVETDHCAIRILQPEALRSASSARSAADLKSALVS